MGADHLVVAQVGRWIFLYGFDWCCQSSEVHSRTTGARSPGTSIGGGADMVALFTLLVFAALTMAPPSAGSSVGPPIVFGGEQMETNGALYMPAKTLAQHTPF